MHPCEQNARPGYAIFPSQRANEGMTLIFVLSGAYCYETKTSTTLYEQLTSVVVVVVEVAALVALRVVAWCAYALSHVYAYVRVVACPGPVLGWGCRVCLEPNMHVHREHV